MTPLHEARVIKQLTLKMNVVLVKPTKSTFTLAFRGFSILKSQTSISQRPDGKGAETITSQGSCIETMADNTSDTWKLNVELSQLFVYVIGLHAVQFGNNWMKKIPRTAKIGRGCRPSPIWPSEEFLNPIIYFQIGRACSPLTYYRIRTLFQKQISRTFLGLILIFQGL